MPSGVMNFASLSMARSNASSALNTSLMVMSAEFVLVVLNRSSKSPAFGASTPTVKSLILKPSTPWAMDSEMDAILVLLRGHVRCRRRVGAERLQEPARLQPGRARRHAGIDLERQRREIAALADIVEGVLPDAEVDA